MRETSSLDTIEIQELLRLLPHRYPFLLIDRIIDIDSDDRATGIKNVTFNEPYFVGHFPGQPIMPGVLMIEAMAQTCGAIVTKRYYAGTSRFIYFMTIDEAKFRRPVIPGDVLQIKVEKQRERGTIYRYRCEAYVGRDKAAQAVISAMLANSRDNT